MLYASSFKTDNVTNASKYMNNSEVAIQNIKNRYARIVSIAVHKVYSSQVQGISSVNCAII